MSGFPIDEVAVKKVFLDTYNRCLAFVLFKAKAKKVHNGWIFPPLCVQDNSYAYALFWYEWIVEDLWGLSEDKENDNAVLKNVDEQDEEDEEEWVLLF